jgi:dimethylaniline monooxygenase (N-oxide forming)
MISPKQVCVIGAGVSGLAAAKAFAAHGHKVTIIEKSGDLGGVWDPARSYPDVQTQSPKDLYRYTDQAMPDTYPEWPKGPQVHAYLSDYARGHGLDRPMRLKTSVVAMNRRTDGKPGWTLELETPNGKASEDFDFVAICTGQFSEPQALSLPGEDAFKAQGGQILHSSSYNDASLAKGRKVVVLGGAKSATDIAVNAVDSGASEVTIVYREPVWRIPYFIGGLVNFKRILYIRAQEQMFASWGIGAPARLAHLIAKPFVWANWRGLESLLKAQFKLGKCKMVPETRIEDGVNCSVPIATPGFFPMVADGRIKAIRGSFDHYEADTIVMSNGERVKADIAVLAIRLQARRSLPARGLSQQARRSRWAISPVPPDRQSGPAGFGLCRIQLQLLHRAMRRHGRALAGALCRQPARASAERARDARQHRVDAAFQARGAAGGERLWRVVRRTLSLQAF